MSAEQPTGTRADAPAQPPPEAPEPPGVSAGRIVLGGVLVLVGLLWLLDAAGIADLQWRVVLPAALTVVGIGLLATARREAHGGLIAVGIVLTVLVAITSIVPAATPLAGIGDRVERPGAWAEVADSYELGMGDLRVDLRDVADFDDGAELSVSVGMGQLVLWLPEGVGADIDASAGMGEVVVLGVSRGGVGVSVSEVLPGDPTLVLDLSVGMGQLEVRQ